MAAHNLTRRANTRKKALVADTPDTRLFQPWFRSKKKAVEIRRQQTPPETRKWATYFQQWGCIRCGKRELPHCALGFCQPCYQTVDSRLKAVLKQVLDDAS